MPQAQVFVASREHARMRLDRFVASRLTPEFSRSQVARMIKAGRVTLNGRLSSAAAALKPGDRVDIAPIPMPELNVKVAPAPEIEVLYDDSEIIVVNKPAGMVVHPSPGNPHSTLVDGLLARFHELAAMAEPDGVIRPGIVHRLDKETSGVMVIARTPFARTALSHQFKERSVRKVYLAIVRGTLSRDRLTIAYPIGRHPVERKRMSVKSRKLREAVTHVRVLERVEGACGPATVVRLLPETGRTHQIRVHLASIGHPCLGDPLYGPNKDRPDSKAGLRRQALHALALSLAHPRTGERRDFIAAPAPDIASVLSEYGVYLSPEVVREWIEAD